MNSKVVRVAVLLAALGAVAAGGFLIAGAEQALRARRVAGATFDTEADAVLADLGRLASAQQGYVAEGQGTDYWMSQAAEGLARANRDLAALAADATADATRSTIQAASAQLENVRTLDQRARQYVKAGQVLMASDVIFTDSLTALNAAGDHLIAARANERAIAEASVDDLRWRQCYAACGAAAILLVAVLLLAPIPEREVDVLTAMRALTEAPALPTARPVAPTPAPRQTLAEIDDIPDIDAVRAISPALQIQAADPLREPLGAFEAAESLAAGETPAPAAATPPQVPEALSAAALASAARVCADMARVLDADDLPGLLARSAGVLGAPGLIVWIADRSGQSLYPLLTHGYDRSIVVRMGPVSTEANNATALAWRTGELQVVEGGAGASGALAAPIVTAEGCVGVLAAELSDDREARADVRALTTIFAAQLATFVTAVPAAGGSALAAEA